MRADNFVGFLTALGFFIGVIFCIMAEYEPLELVAYTCVIALIFFLGSHIAIMNYVDASSGSKIYFDKEWVHLRKSNTEPIIRIYAESENDTKADQLAKNIIAEIENILS